ncbi:Lipoprotein signal peptidase [compost metagenome]
MKTYKYLIVALIVFLLDQASKWYIVRTIPLHESRSVIGEFFQLTSHRNTGAAFSILQDQRWFLVSITIVLVVGIIWYIRKTVSEGKRLLSVALSLVLGGALGNFLDRVLFGEVVDFLEFTFRFSIFGLDVDYPFAIFNLADSAIVIGAILIILDAFIMWRNEKKGATHEQQSDIN